MPKSNSLLSEDSEEQSRASEIAELWLEMRVSGQFGKPWQPVEDGLELNETMRGVATPTDMNARGSKYCAACDCAMANTAGCWQCPVCGQEMSTARVSNSFRWMEQVEFSGRPPDWFRLQELGIGSGASYFDLRRGLVEKNSKNRAEWVRVQAAKIRKTIKRTVRV